MTIQGSDFKLEYDENCSYFDLYVLHVVNAKDEEKRREEYKIEGYSLPLDTAIRKIIKYRLAKRLDVIDLKTYLEEYHNETKKITEVFGEFNLDKK